MKKQALAVLALLFLLNVQTALASNEDGKCGPFQAEPQFIASYTAGKKAGECTLRFNTGRPAKLAWQMNPTTALEVKMLNFYGEFMIMQNEKDPKFPYYQLEGFARTEKYDPELKKHVRLKDPLMINLTKKKSGKIVASANYAIEPGCTVIYDFKFNDLRFEKACTFWVNGKKIWIKTLPAEARVPIDYGHNFIEATEFVYEDFLKIKPSLLPGKKTIQKGQVADLNFLEKGIAISSKSEAWFDGVTASYPFDTILNDETSEDYLYIYRNEKLPASLPDKYIISDTKAKKLKLVIKNSEKLQYDARMTVTISNLVPPSPFIPLNVAALKVFRQYKFDMDVSNDMEVEFINREAENKIPLLKTNFPKKSSSNRLKLMFGRIDIITMPPGKLPEQIRLNIAISVPELINIIPFIGEFYTEGKLFPRKLYCSQYNECGLFDANSAEPTIPLGEGFLPLKITENLKFSTTPYSKEAFQKAFPHIQLEGDYLVGGEVWELRKYLANLPPKVLASIKRIGIYNTLKYYSDIYVCGWAKPEGRQIAIKHNCLEMRVVYHEAAHTRTFDLEDAKAPFIKAWQTLAESKGRIYRQYVKKTKDGNYEWVAPPPDEPRYGCVRAYGCLNYREDIATYTEYVLPFQAHALSKVLIKSGTHYNDIYIKKYNLLWNNGFLSQETYDRLIAQTK